MPTEPPRSLLDRLADGHQSPAWDEFLRVYAPLFQFWLRPHLRQPADIDDVVQDVLLVVLDKLPEFKPVGPAAFRAWLRAITAFRLRSHWQKQLRRGVLTGGTGDLLAERDDPSGEPTRRWDEEHDRHVVFGLLKAVQPGFTATTWQAFWRTVILGERPAAVAVALGLTPNAVYIARSRVMQRLRTEAAGLVDD